MNAENMRPKKQRKKKPLFDSFTKVIVTVLLVNSVAWVWCSYILAALGAVEIAEALSQTAIEVIHGTLLGYFLKSTVENVNKNGLNYIPRQIEPPDDYSGSYHNIEGG